MTDSTIVLKWLSSEPATWSVFVANRVAKIQENSSLSWNHVSTSENPADVASRGIDPSKPENHISWWFGPHWLETNKLPSPCKPEGTHVELKNSKNTINCSAVQLLCDSELIDLSKQNSLTKALRIVAHVKRFVDILRKKRAGSQQFIDPEEMSAATKILLRQEQVKFYSEEINILKTQPHVKPHNKFLKLYPLLYEDILCVGGRLANADFPDEMKYPRIVPEKSELARLIIIDAHHATLHGGTNQTDGAYFGFLVAGIKCAS